MLSWSCRRGVLLTSFMSAPIPPTIKVRLLLVQRCHWRANAPISAPPRAAVPSPRALFDAVRQRESAELRAQDVPDPDGETALGRAASEMFWHADNHALAIKDKLLECRQVHSVGVYVALAEHDVYAAFARYIGCVEACNPHRHRLSAQSSSALAAFHRAMPVEQRDDERRAVDAVLRARELHARERRLYSD
jgi:hypothetical protein